MSKYLLIITCIIFLFSCKNNSEISSVYSTENTIKKNIIDKQNSISWTKELEESRLKTPINNECEKISSTIDYNSEVIKIISENQRKIYPRIESFGNLDVSTLNIAIKQKIYNFCEVFSKGKLTSISDFFINQYMFNCIFFIEEFNIIWQEQFSKNINEENDNKSFFTKWILGEPFIGDEIIQIPIRFYCNTQTLDVTLYLSVTNQYLFYQITLDRWSSINE